MRRRIRMRISHRRTVSDRRHSQDIRSLCDLLDEKEADDDEEPPER